MVNSCLVILLSLLSWSQFKAEKDTVNIKKVLYTRTDSVQVYALLRMSELYEISDVAKATKYAKVAEALANKLNAPQCITLAIIQRGNVLWAAKKNDVALLAYNEALDYAVKFGSLADKREAYYVLGTKYSEIRQYFKSIQFLYQSLQVTDQKTQEGAYAFTLYELGKVNFVLGNSKESLRYYERCLEFVEGHQKDVHLKALVANAVALVHEQNKDYTNAIKYYQKALDICQSDPKLLELSGIITGNLGNVYQIQGKLKMAVPLFKEDLRISLQFNNISASLFTAVGLAQIYANLNEKDSSMKFLAFSEVLLSKHNNPATSFTVRQNYGKVYEALKDYEKANYYYKLALSEVDKNFVPKDFNEIASLQMQHKIAFNEKELELLKKSKELDDSQLQESNNRNQLLLVSLVFLVVIVLFIFLLLRQKVNSNKLLSKKTDIISDQNNQVSLSNTKLLEVNRQKTEIIGIVSHDLKAPINRIKGLLDLLVLDIRNREEYINMMLLSINDANNLIQNLLDNSSLEDGKSTLRPTEFDFITLLNSIIKVNIPQAQYKGIEIITELSTHSLIIINDKLALTRIIENILSNALKFSNKGTQVFIKLDNKLSTHFEIAITDNGPGISLEDQEKLFIAFSKLSSSPTAGESSTGLGLSIVKKLVELMKGKVEVESQVGEGTTFKLFIPMRISGIETTDNLLN